MEKRSKRPIVDLQERRKGPEFDEFIERRIITGMIVSDEYLQLVHKTWEPEFIESQTAQLLAEWCFDYYKDYNKAPKKDMELIFFNKVQEGLDKVIAQEIELILNGLSDEYTREQFNTTYLWDQTKNYFQHHRLKKHAEQIQDQLKTGETQKAEQLARSYTSISTSDETHSIVDPFHDPDRILRVFHNKRKPLIQYSKALGKFWNDQMVREGFVSLLAPEKRGKSFWLIELSMRAMINDCNVAFFQAGDMSEDQFILRQCIYLAKKSSSEKYCDDVYIPVVDCWLNQTGECEKSQRESEFDLSFKDNQRDLITFSDLTRAHKRCQDYSPCRNCREIEPVPWLTRRGRIQPLRAREAGRVMTRFGLRYKKRFRLATYPNETLSVSEIKALLDEWERRDGFIADVVVIDYADILASDPDCTRMEYRLQQGKIWQRLRRLSQEKHCLLITATQAAATSYEKETLRLKDFSETKTKYAHCTACFGLNQTDEEKKIGIMRINALVVREGYFDCAEQVKVLQCLQIGRPFLGSFK